MNEIRWTKIGDDFNIEALPSAGFVWVSTEKCDLTVALPSAGFVWVSTEKCDLTVFRDPRHILPSVRISYSRVWHEIHEVAESRDKVTVKIQTLAGTDIVAFKRCVISVCPHHL